MDVTAHHPHPNFAAMAQGLVQSHKLEWWRQLVLGLALLTNVILGAFVWWFAGALGGIDDIRTILLARGGQETLREIADREMAAHAEWAVGIAGNIDGSTVDRVVPQLSAHMTPRQRVFYQTWMEAEAKIIKDKAISTQLMAQQAQHVKRLAVIGEPVYRTVVRAHQVLRVGMVDVYDREIDVEVILKAVRVAGTMRLQIDRLAFPPLYTQNGEIVDVLMDK